jgi:mannose/fructose-specific phosphotransferase system component IIA
MNEGGVRGVVVGHGELARGLISAVERIAGTEQGVLVGVSNEGLNPESLRARLDEVLGDEPAVIFSDLREGSCGMGARKVCVGRPDRLLVTGTNLSMLLDFVTHRDLSLGELSTRLVERGRGAVAAFLETA